MALHAAVNWMGVKRHLAGWRAARWAVGIVRAAAGRVLRSVGGEGAALQAPLRALADARAAGAGAGGQTSPDELRARLQKAGVTRVQGDADTVRSLVGDDTRADRACSRGGELRRTGG